MVSVAVVMAAAQPADIFGFLPFAARVALAPACLRALFAFLSSFAAFFVALVAAWSMRFSAWVSFAVTLAGMV